MECFKGWTASETIINPVPGVSTEGGAADWVPILGGVNNINKILGIVPKREFSVPKWQKNIYFDYKNLVNMVLFDPTCVWHPIWLNPQLKQKWNSDTG